MKIENVQIFERITKDLSDAVSKKKKKENKRKEREERKKMRNKWLNVPICQEKRCYEEK